MYKKIIFILLSILTVQLSFSQNSLGKSDDAARISLNVFVPDQAENIPDIAKSLLQDKMAQLLTTYSLSGSSESGRFIVVPVVSVLGKEITSSAPAMYVLSIQTSLYIGDGYQGIKFSTTSLSSKGVGNSETKAYIDAIKKMNFKDPSLQGFIEQGKKKIIEYYNSICDLNIKKANTLATQNNFDEAIYLLTDVPEVCKECYDKSMDAVQPIFKKAIDFRCAQSLAKAKSVWSAGQDMAAANSVSELLSGIDPKSSCVGEVNKLIATVSKRVQQLDNREWSFKLKQQQDEVDIKKATIRAARDIGVAYGNNQPKTVYNVAVIRSWYY
jgi:hypothetical protein